MRKSKLKRKNGTIVPADVTVRIDRRRWRQVLTLAGSGPADCVFTAETEPDGGTVVRFGDGVHGARLPTDGDLAVTYRTGGGGNIQVGLRRIGRPFASELILSALGK